jgi:hypothetical protein
MVDQETHHRVRRYHTIDIEAGDQIVTAEDPCPKTSEPSSTGSTAVSNRTNPLLSWR